MAIDREVDIRNYWAAVVKNTDEFQQLAIAENPEFNALVTCIRRALNDSFIQESTEYGVERWEDMLGIVPLSTDTLDDRKVRILTYLSMRLPYTWRVLHQMMNTIVGVGNFEISYVNDTSTMTVELFDDFKLKEVKELLEKVLPQNIVVSYIIPKYAKCVTVADLRAVNSNYKNDLTADGAWNWKLFKLTNGQDGFKWCSNLKSFTVDMPALTNGWAMFYYCTKLAIFTGALPALLNGHDMFRSCTSLTSFTVDLPSMTSSGSMFLNCTSLARFKGDLSSLLISNAYNQGFFQGCRSLTSFTGNLPSLTNGNRMFYSCKLDLASVQNIAATINDLSAQSKTGSITIGMQTNIKGMDELATALATIRSKGWTITEQYNGYVTEAAAVALLDDESIWCKPVESEYGEYVNADGVRYTIDWGHHIEDPDGRCNAELGYTEFFSLYDAAKAWNLTHINEE